VILTNALQRYQLDDVEFSLMTQRTSALFSLKTALDLEWFAMETEIELNISFEI